MVRDSSEDPNEPRAGRSPGTTRRTTLLVVTDDDGLAQMYRTLLAKSQPDAVVVGVDQGAAEARRLRPGKILLDQTRPGPEARTVAALTAAAPKAEVILVAETLDTLEDEALDLSRVRVVHGKPADVLRRLLRPPGE